MRQVAAFLEIIDQSELIDFYNSFLSYRMAQSEKPPSLEEFLALTSKETTKEESGFDEKTDKFLEEQALKRLEERRAQRV